MVTVYDTDSDEESESTPDPIRHQPTSIPEISRIFRQGIPSVGTHGFQSGSRSLYGSRLEHPQTSNNDMLRGAIHKSLKKDDTSGIGATPTNISTTIMTSTKTRAVEIENWELAKE